MNMQSSTGRRGTPEQPERDGPGVVATPVHPTEVVDRSDAVARCAAYPRWTLALEKRPDGVVRRGIDTSLGEAAYCEACRVHMPSGPDACLGRLDGVLNACCGHGGVCQPYVMVGDDSHSVTLRDEAAFAFFATVRPAMNLLGLK